MITLKYKETKDFDKRCSDVFSRAAKKLISSGVDPLDFFDKITKKERKRLLESYNKKEAAPFKNT